jgi:LysR family cys regulon transcriptional activator
MYDFIQLFAPHLTFERVQRVEQAQSVEEIEALFAGLELPVL